MRYRMSQKSKICGKNAEKTGKNAAKMRRKCDYMRRLCGENVIICSDYAAKKCIIFGDYAMKHNLEFRIIKI